MGSGFSKLKKQRKQLEEQMSKMQAELESTEFEGVAGNGLVKVTLNGQKDFKSIKISRECVDPEDVEGLEDLIQGAFKSALEKIESSSPMSNMAGLF